MPSEMLAKPTGAPTLPGIARRHGPPAPLVQIAMAATDKAAWVRSTGFDDAIILRELLMANVAVIHADADLPATTKVRAIGEAVIARRKLDVLMREAIGLTADTIDVQALPLLPIRLLTDAEAQAMRDQQEVEDGVSDNDVSADALAEEEVELVSEDGER